MTEEHKRVVPLVLLPGDPRHSYNTKEFPIKSAPDEYVAPAVSSATTNRVDTASSSSQKNKPPVKMSAQTIKPKVFIEESESESESDSESESNSDVLENNINDWVVDADRHIDHWEYLKFFNWRNRSDMIMDLEFCKKQIEARPLPNGFLPWYNDKIDNLTPVLSRLSTDKKQDLPTLKKIASHFMALGEDTYGMVMMEPDIALFIINEHDWQNFDALITT